ncbi:ArsR/SmtB family transcription factor [Actinoplanes sp. NPDC048988]|uniref:ArsR/SmtB family transcription factor n=1 Tax=Actinoplanes sp. NPDC048988 TaxID=3363901 RepID=UPI003720CB92
MEYLNNTGAAITATEDAELVGLSPSATSYHLRELAKYKLVEQAPSRGDGRERVWRSTGTGLRIDTEGADPAALSAALALVDVFLQRGVRRAREWVERQPDEPEPWRDAGGMTSLELLLTADELRSLTATISTPSAARGRAFAAMSAPIQGAGMVGLLVAGPLVGLVDVRVLVGAAGVAGLLAALAALGVVRYEPPSGPAAGDSHLVRDSVGA